jgi:hypothetical protein
MPPPDIIPAAGEADQEAESNKDRAADAERDGPDGPEGLGEPADRPPR